MNVVKLHSAEGAYAAVERVTVQVSEYSERNGGKDFGCIYAVEVLFPDGTTADPIFIEDLA